MRNSVFLLAIGILIKTLSVLPAASVEMQPGLWELATKVDRDGAVSTRAPRSRCVSAEAADAARTTTDFGINVDAKKMLSARFGQDACKLIDARNSQDLISWQLRCTGNPIAEQEGIARFDSPRHYTLTIRTSMSSVDKTVTSVVTVEGRHMGECPR